MAHPTSRLGSFATAHVHTAGSIRTYVRVFDSMAKEPFHPDRTFAFPKRKFRARERSCQARWFEDYPFLHYDVARDVVLCQP